MQEEEKEAEMGGSGGRATADACELLIHRSGPVMLFSGAEEQKGKCAVSDSDWGSEVGLERWKLLPQLSAVSAPC